MPIYCTPREILKTKTSIIIAINNGGTDLGVWSYRSLYREGGIEGGSCIALAKALRDSALGGKGKGDEEEEPGLIILNPGQLFYSHRNQAALTHTSWLDQPRASAVHPPHRIHPIHNVVPGNATPEAHIAFVFDNIVSNPAFVSPSARLYIVGIVDGSRWLLEYLDGKTLLPRIAALALIQPTHSPSSLTSPALKSLLSSRSRSYIVSPAPLGTLLAAPWVALKPNEWGYVAEIDSPVYSSGQTEVAELIFVDVGVRNAILNWFEEVQRVDLVAGGGGATTLWGILESGAEAVGYVNPREEVVEWEEPEPVGAGEEGDKEVVGDAYIGVENATAMDDDEARMVEVDEGAEDGVKDSRAKKGTSDDVEEVTNDGKESGWENFELPNVEKVEVAGWDLEKDLLEKAGLM